MKRFQKFSIREDEETVLAYIYRMVNDGFRLVGGGQEITLNWAEPMTNLPCKVEEGYRFLHWTR